MKQSRATRHALTLLAALTLATAAAVTLPPGTQLRLHDDAGRLVGEGDVDENELDFEVLPDQAGFASLTVTFPDGSAVRYEVHYSGTGELLLVVDGGVLSLAQFATSARLRLDLDVDDDLDHDDLDHDATDHDATDHDDIDHDDSSDLDDDEDDHGDENDENDHDADGGDHHDEDDHDD